MAGILDFTGGGLLPFANTNPIDDNRNAMLGYLAGALQGGNLGQSIGHGLAGWLTGERLDQQRLAPGQSAPPTVSTIGIDLGKNSFHLVGLDQRGAIVWQLKCSRAQLERRLANIPRCLIGMEACSGAHYIARQLAALGHDVRLMPAQYVKPSSKVTRTTTAMPRRLRKPCSGQPCTSWRSRRRSRWTCWLCIRARSTNGVTLTIHQTGGAPPLR